MLFSWQPDGQMEGQTSPFHRTMCNRQCTAKIHGLVNSCCSRHYTQFQRGPSLEMAAVSESVHSAENAPTGTNCTTSCPPTGAKYPQNRTCCTRYPEAQRRKARVNETGTTLQEFKLLVSIPHLFLEPMAERLRSKRRTISCKWRHPWNPFRF